MRTWKVRVFSFVCKTTLDAGSDELVETRSEVMKGRQEARRVYEGRTRRRWQPWPVQILATQNVCRQW